MADSESAAPPAWTIVGQSETTDQGPDGLYVTGVKVSYQLPNGTTGSVFVPQKEYTPERVRVLVSTSAATRAAVADMTG